MLYILVDILSIFKFKFLTRLIILVNQLMISLQCVEFNEQIEIIFVQLDVFEVLTASLCRFSKYTGYQDWRKWEKSKIGSRVMRNSFRFILMCVPIIFSKKILCTFDKTLCLL